MTTTDDVFDQLPDEIKTWIVKRVQAWVPRKNSSATRDTQRAKIALEAATRIAEAYEKCHGISASEVTAMVSATSGKKYKEFADKLFVWNQQRTYETALQNKQEKADEMVRMTKLEGERDLERAVSASRQENFELLAKSVAHDVSQISQLLSKPTTVAAITAAIVNDPLPNGHDTTETLPPQIDGNDKSGPHQPNV